MTSLSDSCATSRLEPWTDTHTHRTTTVTLAAHARRGLTRGCIPHPYIFVQLLQDSEAREERHSYILLIAFLMPHCPVTVVQRYRDGVCSLLLHLFFIICHPYIPLHLEEMIFYTISSVRRHRFIGSFCCRPNAMHTGKN